MTDEEIRAAAIAAIDSLLKREWAKEWIRKALASEEERLIRMIDLEVSGKGSTYLIKGELRAIENWPVLSPDSLWLLINRGSDILAGSIIDGYKARHPSLSSRIDSIKERKKHEPET